MDCSLPGSSVHGIFQARMLEWVAISLQGIFPTQGSNPCLLHWQADSLPLSYQGSPLQVLGGCRLDLSAVLGRTAATFGAERKAGDPRAHWKVQVTLISSSPAAFLWRPLQGADGTAQVVCTELVHRAGWGQQDSHKWLVFGHLDNPSPPIISTGG